MREQGGVLLATSFFSLSLTFISVISLPFLAQAQSDCPSCTIQIPDSLQIDTFFLEELPDGQYLSNYEGNVSFRLPVNTNEVLFLDPTLPANINLNSIEVKSLDNLPSGLFWSPSQGNYSLPEERNGCITICGLPLQYGLFEVDITVSANIAAIFSRDATFSRTLFIAPPSSNNNGFSITNNVGCDSVSVTFENNNPSNGRLGYHYMWDFGNGNISMEENPAAQAYATAGVYPINYQAIIDTLGPILTEVSILESSCGDFLGRPDFYFRLYDSFDTLVYESNSAENTNLPVGFSINIPLLEAPYRIEIWEGDGGLNFGDDSCGVFLFNAFQTDTLINEELKVLLNILHTADTIQTTDTVIVHPLPTTPMIFSEASSFCEGDVLSLMSSYPENNSWYKDGILISENSDSIFEITSSGAYQVSYTNEMGCTSFSESIHIESISPPNPPVFENIDNVLQLNNLDILPTNYELQWFQEGNLLEENGTELCVTETGLYRLQLNDINTGCSSFFETEIVVNSAINCTTAIPELEDYLESVKVYPNPTSDLLHISITPITSFKEMHLLVVNILGELVMENYLTELKGTKQVSLDLSNQMSGIYLVVLENEFGISNWKVIKH